MDRRRRMSRTLIGVLVLVVLIGVVFALSKLKRVDNATAQPAADIAAPASVLEKPALPTVSPPPAAAPAALVTHTPEPATRPAEEPPAVAPQTGSLSAARAKIESGDFLAARDLLNQAIKNKAADTPEAKRLLNQVNQTLVFSSRRFPNDPHGGSYTVKSGERLGSIAAAHDITWEFLARINNISDPRKLRAGQTLKVIQGPFHAIVDKSEFIIELWLGEPGSPQSLYITSFPVGLGKDDSTPTGVWMVEPHKKLKDPTYFDPRGGGVIAASDPKNPLGEFWIGLTGTEGQAVGKQSYGIHGTIEPESIGTMASMGCIRLKNEDVAVVWEMLVEGKSTVTVRE